MIIYRIFLGFCGVCTCVFIRLCLRFQSVRCSPPWPLLLWTLFRHALRYFFQFFCTQEYSLPFPILMKWCVFISLVHLHLISWILGHGQATPNLLSAFHLTGNIAFSLPLVCLSLAWIFSVFYQVPMLYTEKVMGVFKENVPLGWVNSSPLRIRWCFVVPFHWCMDGTLERWKLQHTGERFKTQFWERKSSVKTWLIQSSKRNSLNAVPDLFNFVLYCM